MNLSFKVLLLTLFLFPVSAFADYEDWETERKALFWTYTTIAAVDYMQTSSALKDPCSCYYEANPLLGRNPSDEKLLGVTLLSTAAMYYWLDNSKDLTFPKIATAIRLGVIVHNHNLGIRVSFGF